MARAKLLPSLNLGVLLPALSNPTFLLNSITMLFPFLIPSNWATLKQNKKIFEADKIAYKTVQLNILSNALSLYFTYLNDQKVKAVYESQSNVLERLHLSLKKQSVILGNVTTEDLEMSLAQWQEAKIRVSKLQALLLEEKVGLRILLGLPLGSELEIMDSDLVPSIFEDKSAVEIADYSLTVAPESAQLDFLIEAAKANKFAKFFGFISTASISGTATEEKSAFNNLRVGGSFSFGADNIVNVRIANNNLDAILLRELELKQENERISEILVGKINETKDQQLFTKASLESRTKVFTGQKRQFELGLISLQNLLQTESQLTDSKVNTLKILMDLQLQRLTLQRLVLDGDFAKVPGCIETEVPEKKKGLFKRKNKKQSLDELCQGQAH